MELGQTVAGAVEQTIEGSTMCRPCLLRGGGTMLNFGNYWSQVANKLVGMARTEWRNDMVVFECNPNGQN